MAQNTLTTVLLAGGAAIAGYELWRARRDERDDNAGDDAPPDPPETDKPTRGPIPDGGPGPRVWPTEGRWIVPVPVWQGRPPVVSDGWGTARGGGRAHRGADLMFERLSSDARYPIGKPNGSAHHVMPDNVLAIAAADGAVWSAEWTARGWAVVIDHGTTWATFYQHLEQLLVRPTQRAKSGQRVRAGDPIGTIGADPLDGAHLKHLHFELWHGGPADAVDPTPYLAHWEHVPDPRAAPAAVARNLSGFRTVGNPGEPYPDWLRDLDGKSGVAAIRSRKSGEVLYVGESEAGNLYKNVTRHFQEWRRQKGYPKGNPKEGHDPGVTYNRDTVDVAVETTPGRQALGRKKTLIAKLGARDNVHHQPKD